MTQQLFLNIRLSDAASFDNFLMGRNHELVERLRAAVRAVGQGQLSSERVLFLWGAPAAGKTHLLQAACHLAQEGGHVAPAYIPLAMAAQMSPAVLEGLEKLPMVCLDDIDRIRRDAAWETALFSLCERLRNRGGLLVAGARSAPLRIGFELADLAARLGWGLVYPLRPLTDAEKLEAMRLRARNRGFELPEEVARYVLRRYPRDAQSLFELLDRIDRASLATQRRVTISLVRDLE